MHTLQAWSLNYILNSLWQVPLIFAAAWLATRLSRRAGPAFQHRLWVSALLVEILLPACSVQPATAFRALQHWLASLTPTHAQPTALVTVTMGAIHPQPGLQLAPALITAVALLFFTSLIFFAAKLGLRIRRTLALRRHTEPLNLTTGARQSYQRYARLFAVSNAAICTSAGVAGPTTLGIRHPMLLLPAGFETSLSTEDLDAAFAHEFAHMRRHDFAKNLLYEALSLPAAFHPLIWLTHNRIAESRELLCDAMAADVVAGPQRYARSLLRLASRFSEQPPSPTTHAIGIFDANHFKNFERRVMHLTHQSIELKGARRWATAAASLILIGAACTSALAFRIQVAAPTVQAAPQPAPQPAPDVAPIILAVPRSAAGDPLRTVVIDVPTVTPDNLSASNAPIKVVQFPNNPDTPRVDNANVRATIDANVRATVNDTVRNEVVDTTQADTTQTARISGGVMAGQRLTAIQPVYPADAKATGVEGTVILNATIGKDGTISSLKLISGPDQLAQAAWDAVKQWTYKPYLLNGEPTAVETTITVNFSLQK